MRRTMVLAICAILFLFLYEASGVLQSSLEIRSRGYIFIPGYVKQFGFRIADMMVDIIFPDFDNAWYANYWQQALDDLAAASPNGEITHVQLRLFWKIDPENRSSWEYPELGAGDGPSGAQSRVMEHWRSWIFGDPEPAYGPSAAERIHNAGFNLEICLSTSWYPGYGTISDFISSVFGWRGREANAPEYPFDGELFLQNYMDNSLRPLAQFLANSPHFQNGDVLMISFEVGYPTADFIWLHNERWTSIIQELRQIFVDAGKPGVFLTADLGSWYDDWGLGHDAVAVLTDNPPMDGEEPFPGISGATYLSELDFISLSFWLELLDSSDVPAVWDDSDIDWVAAIWRDSPRWFQTGTGHGGVPGVFGRDFIADFEALSTVMNNTKILLNTGWMNGHNTLAVSGRRSAYPLDHQAMRVAWAAQIRALGNQSWCAGQDFERWAVNKADSPTRIDTSWRNTDFNHYGVMDEIQAILSAP